MDEPRALECPARTRVVIFWRDEELFCFRMLCLRILQARQRTTVVNDPISGGGC
jgi:hypothetical protein